MSKFTITVVSVNWDTGRGNDNFPTATNCFASLYNPTQVMYGSKNEAETKG